VLAPVAQHLLWRASTWPQPQGGLGRALAHPVLWQPAAPAPAAGLLLAEARAQARPVPCLARQQAQAPSVPARADRAPRALAPAAVAPQQRVRAARPGQHHAWQGVEVGGRAGVAAQQHQAAAPPPQLPPGRSASAWCAWSACRTRLSRSCRVGTATCAQSARLMLLRGLGSAPRAGRGWRGWCHQGSRCRIGMVE
jgi:hypothetical protein